MLFTCKDKMHLKRVNEPNYLLKVNKVQRMKIRINSIMTWTENEKLLYEKLQRKSKKVSWKILSFIFNIKKKNVKETFVNFMYIFYHL